MLPVHSGACRHRVLAACRSRPSHRQLSRFTALRRAFNSLSSIYYWQNTAGCLMTSGKSNSYIPWLLDAWIHLFEMGACILFYVNIFNIRIKLCKAYSTFWGTLEIILFVRPTRGHDGPYRAYSTRKLCLLIMFMSCIGRHDVSCSIMHTTRPNTAIAYQHNLLVIIETVKTDCSATSPTLRGSIVTSFQSSN